MRRRAWGRGYFSPQDSIYIINPRRACAARVTVVGSVCVSVCLSVCLLSHISPMERLFVLKTLSRTQRATKVKKFVGFSLKPLRCRDPALPLLYGHAYSRPFFHAYFSCTRMRISRVYTRMIHRRGFSTLVLFIACMFLYNHKNQCCVQYTAYMCENITWPTSVHVYPHDSYCTYCTCVFEYQS